YEVLIGSDHRSSLERSDHEREAHHRDQRNQKIEYQGAVAKPEACLLERANERMRWRRVKMCPAALNFRGHSPEPSSTANAVTGPHGRLRCHRHPSARRLV